jgi:SAM-dependent methyltransferase
MTVEWERLGEKDPYWGVLSHDELHQVTDGAPLEQFWSSGEVHVERVFSTIRRHVDAEFNPQSALDFGCGVGRILSPLATRVEEAVGIDASSSMLSHARERLAEVGLENVELCAGVENLRAATRTFDLVHSTLVLQHIPPRSGYQLIGELADLLAPGGCGALQIYLGRRVPTWRRSVAWLRARSRLVNCGAEIVKGKLSFKQLPYQMNAYDLRWVLGALGDRGVSQVWIEIDQHAEAVDVMLFFHRPPGPVSRSRSTGGRS